MTKLLPIFFCDLFIYGLPLVSSFQLILNSHLNWISTYINFKFKKNKVIKLKHLNLFSLKGTILILCLYELSSKSFSTTYIYWLPPIMLLISFIIFFSLDRVNISNNKYFGFNYFIILPIVYSLKMILQADSIIIVFLFIELINYILYFQFLTFFNRLTKDTKAKQFDAILVYFWSTFVSLIILLVWILYKLQTYNTTNFLEINFLSFNDHKASIFNTLFFLGIFIKFGAVGLHLLKAEIYKSLKIDSILIFSVVTLFIYIQILYIFLDNLQIIFSVYKFLLFTILIIFSILIVFTLSNTSIFNILALSSVINMTILLLVNLN